MKYLLNTSRKLRSITTVRLKALLKRSEALLMNGDELRRKNIFPSRDSSGFIQVKMLFIFILLLLLVTREFFYFNERHIYKENDPFKITYSITHEPKKNTFSQYFFIDRLMVTTALYPSYHFGETIVIDGKVSKKQTKKGNILVVENPTISKIERTNAIISVAKFVRERTNRAAQRTLPQREAGLLLGVVLGVRDKIDNEYYKMLKNAGVLHVIAASGQNVSIVAALLLAIFLRLVKRKQALLFTSIGVLIYAALTGFDPPIVRASVMAILAFVALFFGRQSSSLYALFLTAWAMLFYQPQELTDVSFQLSFLSTFGILSIKPILDRALGWKILGVVKDDITTTLSAQIATFPIIIMVFGTYSLLSFPINIMVLWTVPIIMIFGGIGAVFSIVSPILAIPFLLVCYPFLAYFTGIIVFFSRFHSQLTLENLPFSVLAGYYLILFALVVRFGKNQVRKK